MNARYGPPTWTWAPGAMRLSATIVVGLTALLLLSSVAFAVPPGEGSQRSPVPFDRTVRLGMTTAGTVEASAAGFVIPRAEVFFSQYRYVVGYEGITILVDELNRAGTARQFGRPLVVYVTDFSGSDPSLTERGYLTVEPGATDRWTPAREAHFLVGSRGRTPDGPAVLPFSRRADARAVAQRIGGTVVDWETLRAQSFGTAAGTRETLRSAIENRTRWADGTVATSRKLLDRPVSVTVGKEVPTLAAAVRAAPVNTTVRLPAGTFHGNVTVEKPLTIRGAGRATHLRGSGSGSVVRVEASRVAIASLRISGVGDNKTVSSVPGRDPDEWDYRVARGYGYGDAGVEFNSSDGSLVTDVTIETPTNGILVRDSRGSVVTDTRVDGTAEWVDGFMGVMVFESRLVVQHSTMIGGRDGVYTHLADGSVIRNNTMRGVRFGVHEMFTSNALVSGNRVREANVGVIVMTTPKGNLILDNDVRDSNEGLSIAGGNSYIAGNVLVDNHIGMAVSGQRSLYERNVIARNGIGIRAETVLPTNRVTRNDVVDNERPAIAVLGPLRVWTDGSHGNYWSGAPGEDRDGDGTLDRSYHPTDPVDRRVARVTGAGTLAAAPASAVVRRLESSVTGLRGTGVVDTRPLEAPERPSVLATIIEAEGAA